MPHDQEKKFTATLSCQPLYSALLVAAHVSNPHVACSYTPPAQHTIFGEVAEGLDVLEAINEAPCDDAGRPLQVGRTGRAGSSPAPALTSHRLGRPAPGGSVVLGPTLALLTGPTQLLTCSPWLQNIRIRHTIILDDPIPDPRGLQDHIPDASPAPQVGQISPGARPDFVAHPASLRFTACRHAHGAA